MGEGRIRTYFTSEKPREGATPCNPPPPSSPLSFPPSRLPTTLACLSLSLFSRRLERVSPTSTNISTKCTFHVRIRCSKLMEFRTFPFLVGEFLLSGSFRGGGGGGGGWCSSQAGGGGGGGEKGREAPLQFFFHRRRRHQVSRKKERGNSSLPPRATFFLPLFANCIAIFSSSPGAD